MTTRADDRLPAARRAGERLAVAAASAGVARRAPKIAPRVAAQSWRHTGSRNDRPCITAAGSRVTTSSAETNAPTDIAQSRMMLAAKALKRSTSSALIHCGIRPASTPATGPSRGNHRACSPPTASTSIIIPIERSHTCCGRKPNGMATSAAVASAMPSHVPKPKIA